MPPVWQTRRRLLQRRLVGLLEPEDAHGADERPETHGDRDAEQAEARLEEEPGDDGSERGAAAAHAGGEALRGGAGGSMSAVVLMDLSPYSPADEAEDAWLDKLSRRLESRDHVLHVDGVTSRDDEDEAALRRGPDGRWWAGRYIGELRFEDREIRIVPRLGIDVVGAWLGHALNLDVVPQTATARGGQPLVVQLVDRVWSAAVADAARHGGPRLRAARRHDGLSLRGRLDVHQTGRHRAARRPLLTSRLAERDLANPVARSLVLADRTLRSLLPDRPTWRPTRCDEVLAQLRGAVGARPDLPDVTELARVRYSPLTRRYEAVATWSHEIARGKGRLTSAAGDDTAGVLLDVAELWELFLLHCARHLFGSTHVVHGTTTKSDGHLLVSRDHPAARLGRIKPDLLILGPDGRPEIVIDAKYKRLRSWLGSPSGVDRGDLYQLAAYLFGHPHASGMLAYPEHATDEAIADTRGPWIAASGQRVTFARVPVHRDAATEWLSQLVAPAEPDRARPMTPG